MKNLFGCVVFLSLALGSASDYVIHGGTNPPPSSKTALASGSLSVVHGGTNPAPRGK